MDDRPLSGGPGGSVVTTRVEVHEDGCDVPLSRERRAELLAVAETDALVALADRCLDGAQETRVVGAPQTGTVALVVREPVAGERFVVGDVLVTEAEVDHGGIRGWAIRLGHDPLGAVAAAICDAEAQRPHQPPSRSGRASRWLGTAVDELCRSVERARRAEATREWAELAPTEVRFEELEA